MKNVKSFKFPFPFILNSNCNDSVAFNWSLDGLIEISKLPTAPLKLSGLFFSGRGFTLIILLPVDTLLDIVS